MQREKVESSNIISVGYDEKRELLEVEFKGNTIYRYSKVPKDVHEIMMTSESIGRFLSTIKTNHKCQKMTTKDLVKEDAAIEVIKKHTELYSNGKTPTSEDLAELKKPVQEGYDTTFVQPCQHKSCENIGFIDEVLGYCKICLEQYEKDNEVKAAHIGEPILKDAKSTAKTIVVPLVQCEYKICKPNGIFILNEKGFFYSAHNSNKIEDLSTMSDEQMKMLEKILPVFTQLIDNEEIGDVVFEPDSIVDLTLKGDKALEDTIDFVKAVDIELVDNLVGTNGDGTIGTVKAGERPIGIAIGLDQAADTCKTAGTCKHCDNIGELDSERLCSICIDSITADTEAQQKEDNEFSNENKL